MSTTSPPSGKQPTTGGTSSIRRRQLLKQATVAALITTTTTTTPFLTSPPPASAADDDDDTSSSSSTSSDIATTTTKTSSNNNKLINLSNSDFTQVLLNDILDKQFLVTGNITRSIYDESCTFQDEIDVYGMDQWIDGTAKLFDGPRSALRLVDDTLDVTSDRATFQFDEDLVFNLPLFRTKPVVHLTGTLILTRNPTTGLITSYKEIWDQGVWEVLKTTKLQK